MFRLFRKLRSKLLNEGYLHKYTAYAIGEIFLVVVGILIALQINNWNEERKQRVVEKEILIELTEDLNVSKLDLINDLKQEKILIQTASKLLNAILDSTPYYEGVENELITASMSLQFSPRTIGFKSLTNKGVDIIENKQLRKEIIMMYDLRIKQLVQGGREHAQNSNPDLELSPFVKKYLAVDKSFKRDLKNEGTEFSHYWYGLKIRDYDLFLKDHELALVLQKTIVERFSRVVQGEKLLKRLDSLNNSINAELKSKFEVAVHDADLNKDQ